MVLVLQCYRLLLALSELAIFRTLVDIEFEYAFLDHAVRKYHFAVSMLNATAPLTLINAAIGPLHLAIAISFVILVLSLVLVPARPSEHSVSVLFIIEVVSLVLVAGLRSLGALPTAFTMLETLLELTNIERPVLPGVLALSIWLSLFILTSVSISVFKKVCSLAML
jgi:hypothetical protein